MSAAAAHARIEAERVVAWAARHDILHVPGALTPTEVCGALDAVALGGSLVNEDTMADLDRLSDLARMTRAATLSPSPTQ